jgi:uncharacterized protein YidB (DUF937 family)
MSFLDSLLNGLGNSPEQASTGAMAGGLAELVQSQGGLGGLITKLGQGGMSDAAASWIGKGQNLPISADQIAQVIGSGPIGAFAQRLGISPEQASQVIASALPPLIDRLTPGGNLADAGNPLNDLLENIPGGLGGALGSLFKR